MPIHHLYHATRQSNLSSIEQNGLQTKYYGAIHGSVDIHVPKPALYLSRSKNSDNLHADLFGKGEVVVLKIAATYLDENEIYPDDFLYQLVTEGEIFTSSRSIQKALGCSPAEAEEILEKIEEANEETLPLVIQPFWRWYLRWDKGGEIAYTADIPPAAIVDFSPYGA